MVEQSNHTKEANHAKAGVHLLLVSSESGLDEIAQAIVGAVETGLLELHQLLKASEKVKGLTEKSRAQVDAGLYVSYSIPGGHLTRKGVHLIAAGQVDADRA